MVSSVLVISAIVVISLSGYLAFTQSFTQTTSIAPTETYDIQEKPIPENKSSRESPHSGAIGGQDIQQPQRTYWSPIYTRLEGCEEVDVRFTHLPLDIESIKIVEPQGELTDRNSGHITPGDHIGFQYDKNESHTVYAIADGYLKRVERNKNFPFEKLAEDVKNYHLYFEYSCSLFGSYVHVTSLSAELVEADKTLEELNDLPDITGENNRNIQVTIPVKSGQVLGKTTAYGLLGMLTVDTDVTLDGFVNSSMYSGEPWKIHSVSPFDYFDGSLCAQMLEKNPRMKEPLGGKIDFDVDGRLPGNWFLEGSGGWSSKTGPAYCGDYLCPYWDTHLAFVYDFIDPDQIRISIGHSTGIQTLGPYGVKGNSPDPANVAIDDGLIKYELISLVDVGPEQGIFSEGKVILTRGNEDDVVGTLLVQMVTDRKIKMEVFPDKTAVQVDSFTENARIYER